MLSVILLLLLFSQLSHGFSSQGLEAARYNRHLLRKLARKVDKEYFLTEAKNEPIKTLERHDRNLGRLNRDIAQYLFDGDMLVSAEFLQQLVNDDGRKKRQAYKDRYYPSTIWTKGIPYTFDPELPQAAIESLEKAMAFWQAETCVTFFPRQNESQYLYYTGQESGCFSTVGRDTTQPKQIVNIGRGCYHFGVTSHEVAHSIGLFHHQQRTDRDNHIRFIKDNVPVTYLQNFAKISATFISTYDTPYDVGSVMHYTPTEFAIDHFQPALEAIDANLQGTMGSMDKPSFLDVQLVNRHYQCADKCGNATNLPSCINGGYVDPLNCTLCKCPTGFGGPRCNLIESSDPMPCGGLLPASSSLQRLKITLRAGAQRRQCVYQIRAPKNRRVMIGIERVQGKCQEGCYTTGMETKMLGDFRPVGYRFCCQAHSFRRLISVSSASPVMFFAVNGTLEATIYYRWIVKTPDAEDSVDLTKEELNEIYDQKNDDFGIDMQVSRRNIDNSLSNDKKKIANDELSDIMGTIGSDGDSNIDFSIYT